MRRSSLYLFVFLLMTTHFLAQRKVTKPQVIQTPIITKAYPKFTNLGFGAGLTRSVLYLGRNVKQNNDASGLNLAVVYGGARLLRTSVEYTYFWPIDIAPTWYNIRAHTIEANMHVLARFKNKKAYFYPLFGLSYNVFEGNFTGENDFLNLRSLYKPGERVSTKWFGFNVGTGFEYYFRPGSFFLDYKMRIGKTEGIKQINIQDVCFTFGLRFNLRVPSIYTFLPYRGVRSRYLLNSEDED